MRHLTPIAFALTLASGTLFSGSFVSGMTLIADESDDAVGALIDTAENDIKEVRLLAINSLGELKSDRKDVVRSLSGLVTGDEDAEVKIAAFVAYLQTEIPLEEKANQLIDWLRTTEDALAEDVKSRLIGYPEDAIPQLSMLLESNMEPAKVKLRILELFATWGPIAKEGVPVMIDLYNREPELRLQVLETLAEVGTDARAALPIFTKAMRDDKPEVRALAAVKVTALLTDAKPPTDARSRLGGTTVSSQAAAVLRMFDSDGNGVIEDEERERIPGSMSGTLDRDKDGRITRSEINMYYMLRDRSRRSSSVDRRGARGGSGGLTRPATPRQ